MPILAPATNPWEYFSPKKQMHNLKYEIGLHMIEEWIVWVSQSYKGSVHGLIIARDKLCKKMGKKETELADKGYVAQENFFYPKCDKQKLFNNYYKVGARIEMLNNVRLLNCH